MRELDRYYDRRFFAVSSFRTWFRRAPESSERVRYMVEQASSGWVAVMHPDLRVTYQRGVYQYAKSLMAGMHLAEPSYRLVTDATSGGSVRESVESLVRDIDHPRKLGVRAWQMLPRYLKMRFGGDVRVDQWDLPSNVELGDRTSFLRSAGGLANIEMIYEVCRLAGSKSLVPPVDMDFLHESGADVVLTTAPSAVRSRSGRVKIIQTVHDLFLYDDAPHSTNARKFRRKVEACVQHADMIVSMSAFTTEVLLRHHPEAEQKVRLLYQPIPADEPTLEQSAQASAQDAVLKKFNLAREQFILYVGAVEPRKNVANLIRAHRLSAHASKNPLVIAGGVEAGYLQSEGLPVDLGAAGVQHVKGRSPQEPGALLIGRVSELEKLVLLRCATAFAFPSLIEGFGIPVLEAQSLGCPVLASAGSTMPEVLGDSAVLIDQITDTTVLALALDQIVTQPQLARDLARRGLVNSERFSKQRFARRLAELVAECRAMPAR